MFNNIRKKTLHYNSDCKKQNPYSPDMSPSDFDLFAKMKLPLGGVRFSTRQSIIAAVEQSLRRLVLGAVDGIRLVVSLMCGGRLMLEITSDH